MRDERGNEEETENSKTHLFVDEAVQDGHQEALWRQPQDFVYQGGEENR